MIFVSTYLGNSIKPLVDELKKSYLEGFGWLFIVLMIFISFIFFKIYFKYGNIIIGGPSAKPDFSKLSWISMLFSAGLGTGLLYSGTYEPIFHYFFAPQLQSLPETARFLKALDITFFHWGLPAWIIYGATGLFFAFYGFNLKKGFQFSLLIPKEHFFKRLILNVLAILAILVGVVSTFAIAAKQINAGLHLIIPSIQISQTNSILIIFCITLMATFSVLSGLHRGIKYLSQLNVFLVVLLFAYLFLHISFYDYFDVLIESFGIHLNHFFENLTYTAALKDKEWVNSWTMLYWAWWAAWAPFVGLFIARISYGRSIKEFIEGTVFLPSLICIVWFSLFGYLGFQAHIKEQINFTELLNNAPFYTLFSVLENTAFPFIASIVSLVCITVFYVTSSDSGSFVVDMIASGGKKSPHSYLKMYWSLMEGLLAAVLFYFGGIELIKSMVVLISLPMLVYIAYALYQLLKSLPSYKEEEL